MALAYVASIATGSGDTFPIPFGYNSTTDISVTADGVAIPQSAVQWINPALISITPNPQAGAVVGRRRTTPSSAPFVVWTDDRIGHRDLNKVVRQMLFVAEEAKDAIAGGTAMVGVVEFPTLSSFPVSGEVGILYVAIDTSTAYRWTGSTYVALPANPASTDDMLEGALNLYFTSARVRGTYLTGLAIPAESDVVAGDTVLSAFGKLQAQATATRALAFPRLPAGTALPTEDVGPIWHDDYASMMTWRVFNANGAAYTGYASVDIGRIIIPGAGVAEAGTLKASGAIFNPSTYLALYHWAVHRGVVVASGSWAQGREQYGYIDATQVRLPDLRGEGFRFWDDGRGVDSGRGFGTWQDHMLQTHLHTGFSLAVGLVIGTGSGYAATTANTSAPMTGNVGSETRMRNTAMLATIKF